MPGSTSSGRRSMAALSPGTSSVQGPTVAIRPAASTSIRPSAS